MIYSLNLLQNGDATDLPATGWDNVIDVTQVVGGIIGDNSFRFEPTASMNQTMVIPGQPPDLEFQGYFLPGRDINSASQVKAEIVVTLIYGDGSEGQYIIPGKTFISGGF